MNEVMIMLSEAVAHCRHISLGAILFSCLHMVTMTMLAGADLEESHCAKKIALRRCEMILR